MIKRGEGDMATISADFTLSSRYLDNLLMELASCTSICYYPTFQIPENYKIKRKKRRKKCSPLI
jgi:hypothetical protein